MADINPHTILGEGKLVTLDALKRYHHKLLANLGLVQDTAEYAYNGERTDFPEDVKSIGEALDKLYDMAKEGALEFNSGKADDADETIEFDSEDSEDTNIYWINAKVGDKTVNIKLDANDFVKDSVLDSVALVNKSTNEETIVLTLDGKEAEISIEEGKEYATLSQVNGAKSIKVSKTITTDLTEDGTYFYYTWRVDNGEGETTYNFTSISLKEIYGDIHDDNKGYVHYDKDTAEISVDTAKVTSEIGKETKNYYWNAIYTSGTTAIKMYSDEAKTELVETIDFTGTPSEANITAKIAESGYENVVVSGIDRTRGYGWGTADKQAEEETKNWKVDSEDTTNLATAENLANVANDLQDQIEALENKSNLVDGTVTLSNEATENSLVATVDENGSKYDLTLMTTTDDDIDDLFVLCTPTPAESISENSTVNNGNIMTTAGDYQINVGEQPAGSETNITWERE